MRGVELGKCSFAAIKFECLKGTAVKVSFKSWVQGSRQCQIWTAIYIAFQQCMKNPREIKIECQMQRVGNKKLWVEYQSFGVPYAARTNTTSMISIRKNEHYCNLFLSQHFSWTNLSHQHSPRIEWQCVMPTNDYSASQPLHPGPFDFRSSCNMPLLWHLAAKWDQEIVNWVGLWLGFLQVQSCQKVRPNLTTSQYLTSSLRSTLPGKPKGHSLRLW